MDVVCLDKDEKENYMNIRGIILDTFKEVLAEEGFTAQDPADSDLLLETDLDSLGFAVLVARLEDKVGFDPFTISTSSYYPKTFGEFIQFYENVKQQVGS